jgi:serine protease inhibitor
MRRLTWWFSITSVAALVALGACHAPTTAPNTAVPQALTSLPQPLSSAERSVVAAANTFAFALFDTAAATETDSNLILSPLSASLSLGMALNGAAGATYEQLMTALQFGNMSQHDIDTAYESLMQLLTSLDPAVQVTVANSIWYDQTFPFYPSFIDTARTYFRAQVQPLDFADVAGSLSAINGWVDAQTHGDIPSMLSQIGANDVMFLLNAISFSGTWRTRFDPALTQMATFTTAGGTIQQVPLMHRLGTMLYAEGAAYQAVDLSYGDSAFAMTVLLPKLGTSVATLVDSLSPTFWNALTTKLHDQQVELYLPRLTLSCSQVLNSQLEALGIRDAFAPTAADFTHMSPDGNALFISAVRQNTYLRVDENGTKASATTATGVSATSATATAVMRVDRPYVIVIRDRLSGAILFLGSIAEVT